MNQFALGDPLAANANTAYTPLRLSFPSGQGGRARIINRSGYDLSFFFLANKARVYVPSRAVRVASLPVAESQGVQWSILATDTLYLGPSNLVIECYDPAECDIPFDVATNAGLGSAGGLPIVIGSAAQDYTVLKSVGEIPLTTLLTTPLPTGGIYRFSCAVLVNDSNAYSASLLTEGDLIRLVYGFTDNSGFFHGSRQFVMANTLTGAVFIADGTPGSETSPAGAQDFANGWYSSLASLFLATEPIDTQADVSVALNLAAATYSYANDPTFTVWTLVELMGGF